VDPSEPEPKLEDTTPPSPLSNNNNNTRALLVHHHGHGNNGILVAPAAVLLRVVHAILPLYAILIRLAVWRRRIGGL
jgi:hypothetical protein